jgi:hypothetical protein
VGLSATVLIILFANPLDGSGDDRYGLSFVPFTGLHAMVPVCLVLRHSYFVRFYQLISGTKRLISKVL